MAYLLSRETTWKGCLILKSSVPAQPFEILTVLALSPSRSQYPAYLFSLSFCPTLYYLAPILRPLSISLLLSVFNFTLPLHFFLFHPLLYRLFCHPPLLCYVLLCLYIYREMVKCSKIGCFDPNCVIQNRLISTI